MFLSFNIMIGLVVETALTLTAWTVKKVYNGVYGIFYETPEQIYEKRNEEILEKLNKIEEKLELNKNLN